MQVYFLLSFSPVTYMHPSSLRSCYTPFPLCTPRLDFSDYTWGKVQVTKLFVIFLSLHLSSLKIPLSTLFSMTFSPFT
jgi:hypothetical protein